MVLQTKHIQILKLPKQSVINMSPGSFAEYYILYICRDKRAPYGSYRCLRYDTSSLFHRGAPLI